MLAQLASAMMAVASIGIPGPSAQGQRVRHGSDLEQARAATPPCERQVVLFDPAVHTGIVPGTNESERVGPGSATIGWTAHPAGRNSWLNSATVGQTVQQSAEPCSSRLSGAAVG